jgi:hypothetical protein
MVEDDSNGSKPARALMPWERTKGVNKGRKGRPKSDRQPEPKPASAKSPGRPRKHPKPDDAASKSKRRKRNPQDNPQLRLQRDLGIVDILREMREASAEDLPLGDPPAENGPGAFENAAPNPKIFSDFESSETDQTTDNQPTSKSKIHGLSSYKEEYPTIAEKATRVGFTVKELADLFNVTPTVINRWILKHADFAAAIRLGRGHADDRIERNLFMRACGYDYIAEKPMNVGGQIEIAQYKEHVKPDIVAQIFWLKNRRPENWRDVQQHEHGNAGEFANMDDKQLMEEIQKASQELAKLSDGVEPDTTELPETKH